MARERAIWHREGIVSLLAALATACAAPRGPAPPPGLVPEHPPDRGPEPPQPQTIETVPAPATGCPAPPAVAGASGAYNLGDLQLFSRTLFYVRENYPEDIAPRARELLVKALEAIPPQENQVAVERDPVTPPRWVKVAVAGQECTLNIQRVDAPWSLRSRLQDAVRFVQGYLPPAPSVDQEKRLIGIEFALTNGMLSGLDRQSRLIDAESYRILRRLQSGPGPTAMGGGAIPAPDLPSAGPVVAAPTRIAPGSTVAYLRIPHFTRGVSGEVQRALVAATASSPKGFVLDLRDNSGGLLEEAMKVADAFIRTGTLASVASAKKELRRDLDARNDGYEPSGALVVLVNRKTGAASELVAAAIKNLGRGIVLGEPTAGAGSLMLVFDLPMSRRRKPPPDRDVVQDTIDGAKPASAKEEPAGEPFGLLLATARLLAAGGGQIEGTGVQPDVDRGWSTNESQRDQDCLRQFANALIAKAGDPQPSTLLSTAKTLADKTLCGPATLFR